MTFSLIQFKGVRRTTAVSAQSGGNSLAPGIFSGHGVQRLSLTHDNRIVWLNRARNRRRQTPSISSRGVISRARLNAIYYRLSYRVYGRKCVCVCVCMGVYAFPFFFLPPVTFHSSAATITSPVDSRRPVPSDPHDNPHPQPSIEERKEGLTVYTSDHPSLLLRLS